MLRKIKNQPKILVAVFLSIGLVIGMTAWTVSQENRWYPSIWGADDQRGALNRLTTEKVLGAVSLIKTGKVYELGRVYEDAMPLFGTRHFSLRIPQMSGPLGDNQVTWHEEIFSGEIGQIGTQFDGLAHIGIGDIYYNGLLQSEIAKAEGFVKLGVENVGAIVTRGVLIDIVGYKGVEHLEDKYEITADDLEGALRQQGITIGSGDVVLIHTGWGRLWITDNERYNESEPGIGLDAGKYLVDQEIVMVCADNWAIEVVPNPNESISFPVHQLFLPQNGIYNLENIITEELAKDKVYEFAFIFTPLKLKGATGSPGSPIAIH
ncbi:TPA: cyclase family protein [Candidatus Poribacteria bacterium]|nr:cyclase family protein [Candidatus Poribacteria bacterium]HIC01915.1 cyclase family protein [Candidatus Poribacteria bacterium]